MFGFIKNLKNLFNPKTEIEEIRLESLESWFKEQTAEAVEGVKADLSSMFSRFDGELARLKENLGLLEKAELQNPNISMRERQIMEGNRQAYMKKVYNFMDSIALEKNQKRVQEFCSSFDESLDNLGKSTSKPYFVLQEFFSNESRRIAQNIKSLEKNIRDVRSIMEREDIKQIEATEKAIKDIFSRIELKKSLEKGLDEIKKELLEDGESRKRLADEITKAKNSREMKELQQLKKEEQLLQEGVSRLKSPFLHDFAVIEAALKKYSKIALDEKTVLHYMENPVNKLQKDNDLKIVKILENIKDNISRGAIELKDKKMEKTLQTIGIMDREYFENFLKEHDELIGKWAEFNEKIIGNKIEERIKELNFRLRQEDEKIEGKNQKMQRMGAELNGLSLNEMTENLEKGISLVVKKEIKIII